MEWVLWYILREKKQDDIYCATFCIRKKRKLRCTYVFAYLCKKKKSIGKEKPETNKNGSL